MKRKLLILTSLLVGLMSQAQIVLNSNEMLAPGGKIKMKSSQSFSVIDTSVQGAGVTWDFSALVPGTDELHVEIQTPQQTPFGAFFTTANYAYKETPTAYRYFNLSSSKLERVGSYVSSAKTYSNPQTEMVYPLSLGTYNADTWQNTGSSSGGVYELTCVGTGTLKLPGGKVHNNVIMVRAYLEEFIISLNTYFWYDADNGAVLCQYIAGDGFFIDESINYTYEITTSNVGISESAPFGDISYINPVVDKLELSFGADVIKNYELSVMDLTGKVLKTLSGKTSDNHFVTEIPMYDLSAGVYLIKITDTQTNAMQLLRVVNR